MLSALGTALDGSALPATRTILDIFVLEVFTGARVLILFDNLRRLISVSVDLSLLSDGLLSAVFDHS